MTGATTPAGIDAPISSRRPHDSDHGWWPPISLARLPEGIVEIHAAGLQCGHDMPHAFCPADLIVLTEHQVDRTVGPEAALELHLDRLEVGGSSRIHGHIDDGDPGHLQGIERIGLLGKDGTGSDHGQEDRRSDRSSSLTFFVWSS